MATPDRGVPFVQQDTQLVRCAHAAAWWYARTIDANAAVSPAAADAMSAEGSSAALLAMTAISH